MRAFYTTIVLLCAVILLAEALIVPVHLRSASPPELLIVGRPTNESLTDRGIMRRVDSSASTGLHVDSAASTGLYVDDTCVGPVRALLLRAIRDAGDLALAGHGACEPNVINLPGNPLPYFFPPSDFDYVRSKFDEAVEYLANVENINLNQDPIQVSCTDTTNYCSAPDGRVRAAYSEMPGSRIVICPRFFLLGRPTLPCSGFFSEDGLVGIGCTTQALVFLHEFMHTISGHEIVDFALGTRACHDLVVHPVADKPPRNNADSYARLTAWSHDLGLKFPESASSTYPYPPLTCLEWFQPDRNAGIGESPSNRNWQNGFKKMVSWDQ